MMKMKNKQFRVIESREKYITENIIINDKIYVIQEFCRGCFGFGKKKWRDFYASSYSGMSRVEFKHFDMAKRYLYELKEFYKNEN